MRQEGKAFLGRRGSSADGRNKGKDDERRSKVQDHDGRSKVKIGKDVEREKTPRLSVELDHLGTEGGEGEQRQRRKKKKKSKSESEEEEERRSKRSKSKKAKRSKASHKKKKTKSKKKVDPIKLLNLINNQSDDTDTESSSSESMDSDMAEDMLKKIRILQKESKKREKEKKRKKRGKRDKMSRPSSSSSSDGDEDKTSSKKKKNKKEKKKKEKEKKQKKKRSPSNSDSDSASSSEESSDSEEDVETERKIAKRRRELAKELELELAKKSQENASLSVPPVQKKTIAQHQVAKSKWETSEDEESVAVKKPKIQKNPTVPGIQKNPTVPGIQKNPTVPGIQTLKKRSICDLASSAGDVVVLETVQVSKQVVQKEPASEIMEKKVEVPLCESTKLGTYKTLKEVSEPELEPSIAPEVRSIRYRSQSSSGSAAELTQRSKTKSKSKTRSRSRPASRSSSTSLSKSPSRSKSKDYKRRIRYESRSRSRSRHCGPKDYRSRSRSQHYRPNGGSKYYRSRSRSRDYRPESGLKYYRSRSRSREHRYSSRSERYRASSRSRKYRSRSRSRRRRSRSQYRPRPRSRSGSRQRRSRSRSHVGHSTWSQSSQRRRSKEQTSTAPRSPPRSLTLQERLDSAANKRRRELEQTSSSAFTCGVRGSEEAVKVREEAKREFQAKLDQIIETHTSDVSTKVNTMVPTAASKPGRTPIVFDVKEAQERRLVGESLTSVIQGKVPSATTPFEEGFCLMEKEEGQNPCFWCKSNIHGSNTCPLKHSREYGVNPMNEYGVMQDCEQCGSYNHMIDICPHSEENGRNMVCQDGKKLICYICGSHDHMLESLTEVIGAGSILPSFFQCKEKDNERNGRNKLDDEGTKPRCSHCGSWDHLPRACTHTYFAGRNRTISGKKERCQFCGSFGHVGEEDCAKQSDIVREFLRLQIGAEKIRPRVKRIGKFEDFSHIANSKTIVRDTLSTEEKLEQKDAEKKLKERLMAKFGIKGAKEEEKPASPKPVEAQVAVFEEEVQEGDYYSPEEPDPSVFDGKDLRTPALAGYKQITEQMHNCVIDCLRGERDDVVTNFNITMTKKDLYCLTGENWLNDKALEFYLQMVAYKRCQESQFNGGRLPRVHTMSTYFFLNLIMRGYEGSIQRWNKDVDIFTFHMVLVPIHLQEHWCLAIIDFRNKALLYYDPMGGENMPALSALLNYIGREHMYKKGRPIDLKLWAKEMVKDWPEQENTADCGMFVVKAAEFFSRDAPVKFSQEDMPYFRKRMIWEVVNNTLISP